MSDFYVGYLPKAPSRLARTIMLTVLALEALAIAIALLLVFGQLPFAAATFEFQQYRDFEGVLEERPYPSLLVSQDAGLARYLLVAPGKRGASPLVAGLAEQRVRLRASLIQRDNQNVLELVPGSVHAAKGVVEIPETVRLGSVDVPGEIVDSKCYFGVMNPGRGKVHRDCAVRCISGGIPPVLVARTAQGAARYLILAGPDGAALNRYVLDLAAQRVRVRGELFRSGDTLILKAEPRDIVRGE